MQTCICVSADSCRKIRVCVNATFITKFVNVIGPRGIAYLKMEYRPTTTEILI